MLLHHTVLEADNPNRLLRAWLVPTYRVHKSISLLVDNSDRLSLVPVVKTYRLPHVRLVQRYTLHKSGARLLDNSGRLDLVQLF